MEHLDTTLKSEFTGDMQEQNSRERRRLEMKRRYGLLHHKRGCLERELQAINNALIILSRQLDRDASISSLSSKRINQVYSKN